MEAIAEFNDNHGFNVKLTSEKIFIESAGNSETIALRGLNGVRLYDDLEKYNKELEEFKTATEPNKPAGAACATCGLMLVVSGLMLIEDAWWLMLPGGVFTYVGYGMFTGTIDTGKEEPILDSFFHINVSW